MRSGRRAQALFVRCGFTPQFHRRLASASLIGGISTLACSPTPSFFLSRRGLRDTLSWLASSPLRFSSRLLTNLCSARPLFIPAWAAAAAGIAGVVESDGYRFAKYEGESIFTIVRNLCKLAIPANVCDPLAGRVHIRFIAMLKLLFKF